MKPANGLTIIIKNAMAPRRRVEGSIPLAGTEESPISDTTSAAATNVKNRYVTIQLQSCSLKV